MKLIRMDDFQIKVADEALLVRPIRKLFNQDRSQGKEQFFKQMSVLFYVYNPASNYSYIFDEKERLAEVLKQEAIKDWKPSADFNAAVEVYRNLCKTPATELLEDTRSMVANIRQAMKDADFAALDEKDKFAAMKNATATVSAVPNLIKTLMEVEKMVAKEMEETTQARGSQELTVGDMGLD